MARFGDRLQHTPTPAAQESRDSLALYQAALSYLRYSNGVIPIHTDPERAKVAAVAWSTYQQRRATPEELHAWFVEEGYTGLAIVTGAVSGLIVLDFDDRKVLTQFQLVCPDLATTYQVRTRRGVHLYFRTTQIVPSRKAQGIDLKGEGGYVVAPPTQIGQHTYTIIDSQMPRTLSATDLSRIQTFLASVGMSGKVDHTESQEPAFLCEIEAFQEVRRQLQTPVITSPGLVSQYRYQAMHGSRNEALFRISLRARDLGYDEQAAIDLLAELHARQPGRSDHHPESYRQRHREAVATIHSAYSRPPRRQQSRGVAQQLPNSVREKLFQMKQTSTVRVIEGLRLAGIQSGQAFTYKQMLEALAGKVGQWSIRQAIAATTEDGATILAQSPLGSPKQNANADSKQATSLTIHANGSPEKPTFLNSRRHPAHYIMPSNEELCLKLGVKMTGSDVLTEEDLASAKQTRMATHREFIKRRPGMYPRRWLARRLGVCTDTLDTYNRDIPIHVRHIYAEKAISWHNLHDIPLALDLPGTFLEDDTGKRYPAKREIAKKLLAWKHTVVYKHQDANFYWYEDVVSRDPSPLTRPVPVQTAFLSAPAIHQTWHTHSTRTYSRRYSNENPIPDTPPVTAPTQRDDPAVQARLAEKVYRVVKRLSTDKAQVLSKANAHRLIATYGVAAVEQGLKRLKWYAGKGRVQRPAGFLITASRLAWREHSRGQSPAQTRPDSGQNQIPNSHFVPVDRLKIKDYD